MLANDPCNSRAGLLAFFVRVSFLVLGATSFRVRFKKAWLVHIVGASTFTFHKLLPLTPRLSEIVYLLSRLVIEDKRLLPPQLRQEVLILTSS